MKHFFPGAATATLLIVISLFVSSCQPGPGSVLIDGSSTVYPISKAMANSYREAHPGTEIVVNYTSTGVGMEKFIAGKSHIVNASRHITQGELSAVRKSGIEIIELPIAYDGITIVVNPANDWVDYLTLEELTAIFSKDSTVKTWQDIREGWPARPLVIYAPDYNSGTYDYFSSAVTGKENHIEDYVASEDDNVLINGVRNDQAAIGYLGYSYFDENRETLKSVAIDSGAGPVTPTVKSISSGSYTPLSRPLFIYVAKRQVEGNNVVTRFVKYYLQHAPEVVRQAGYIPLPGSAYTAVMQRFTDLTVGSPFLQANGTDKPVVELVKTR